MKGAGRGGEDLKLRVVVMGCGRVGSSVADGLSRIGHDVAVIDRDSTAFNRLSPEYAGERVLGQGFDRDVLLRARIEEADDEAAELTPQQFAESIRAMLAANPALLDGATTAELMRILRVSPELPDRGRDGRFEP